MISIRSCDSDSITSYGVMPSSRRGTFAIRLRRHHVRPVLPVAVLDQQRDGRPERLARPDAAQDLDPVGLDLHPRAAPVAHHAAPEIPVHVLGPEQQARGHALEHRDQRLAVGFAGGREIDHRTDGMTG